MFGVHRKANTFEYNFFKEKKVIAIFFVTASYRGKLPKELNIKCAHCAVVVALNQSWDSQKELLIFFHLSEGGSALDLDLRQYRRKKKKKKKKEPFLLLFTAPFFCLHHLAEDRWRLSILFLPPLGTGLPLYTVTARLFGAAQRTGAQLEESRGENRTGEQKRGRRWRTDGLLPSDRRDYTPQHPVASTCLGGIKDLLGLPP